MSNSIGDDQNLKDDLGVKRFRTLRLLFARYNVDYGIIIPMPDATPCPSLASLCDLVLQGIPNPSTRSMYAKALRDFLTWLEAQSEAPLTKALVQRHIVFLTARGYAASSVNQRLAAIRKFVLTATDQGLVAVKHAASILRIQGVRRRGVGTGNWLTTDEAEKLMNAPDPKTPKGKRDRAILGLMVGCGLRRSEVVRLNVEDLQRQEGRWVLLNVIGMRGRTRTVPLPPWAKLAIVRWMEASCISEGPVFRAVGRDGKVGDRQLSAPMILEIVSGYATELGLKVRPRDLRRTCAKLCRSNGGDLEQIQMLLGHSSIQITEQYLGTRQDLAKAPNDRIGLRWRTSKKLAS